MLQILLTKEEEEEKLFAMRSMQAMKFNYKIDLKIWSKNLCFLVIINQKSQ